MQEVTEQQYEEFLKQQDDDTVKELNLGKKQLKQLQPRNFRLETSTIWKFPDPGSWATHPLNANFRANWSPRLTRNLLLRYSKEGDTVLDPFVGSGTTLIECKLTRRKGIGVDLSRDAVMLTRDRLNFSVKGARKQRTYVGDSRNLKQLKANSIELIAAHPPYLKFTFPSNQIGTDQGELSDVHSLQDFRAELQRIGKELYRVLKPGKVCAVLIGDAKRDLHLVPVGCTLMEAFQKEGFCMKEHIIVVQEGIESTPELKQMSIKANTLLLIHEHLLVFEKPK